MTGTFEGVGTLQFTPDNKHAYAFSGEVGVTDSSTLLLEITTQGEYIVGTIQPTNFSESGDDMIYKVLLNDIPIVNMNQRNYAEFTPFEEVEILIPAFTKLTINCHNATASTERNIGVLLIGKVQGAIEQINLESITDDNKWAKL